MNKPKNKLLIYGATGYTGKLISERAKELNLDFVIAGRSSDALESLAAALGVGFYTFPVEDQEAWKDALTDVDCLINAAGPFKETAVHAMKASIENGVHYLDISAELDSYQLAESLDAEAKKAGVMLISGAGMFVSYDALALHTARRVNSPQKLSVAFRHFGGFSRGSVKSSKNIMDIGMLFREAAEVKLWKDPEPKFFDFGNGEEECLPTPLGGIILSFKSTGIPNIEEYFQLKLPAAGMPSLDMDNLPDGPTEEERAEGRTKLSAEVTDADGKVVRSIVDAPSGYTLTPLSVVAVASRILNGEFKPGYQSPASAYGESIINDIPDTSIQDL
ncbi:saccharopine dehydrogenase NADP-binding domain-containing protein [Pedobacter sp. MC2016-15]|uniref:saccharopine dehydrogenase family protein n=1 Tax=Pedobacter sp. MC2016-15 TaxID=2994473 RepID=UPI0022456099|nr:saccharopine dehydrogenase NADP-binding domain-containing protein [Pedobacter sp. MC2016-15]MCX2479426.1 saccharopine dehydrogenase NADP-binding domain-containing protein [Pedobacter sp. MC2016-15]